MTKDSDRQNQSAAETLLARIAGTRTRALATSLAIFCIVFISHWLWGTYQPRQLPLWLLLAFGSAISGTVAGGLAGAVLWLYGERQKALRKHAWEILQLNHHIRNAMQVIAYSQSGLPKEQVNTVMDALNRISEALRTISSSQFALQTKLEETARRLRDSMRS